TNQRLLPNRKRRAPTTSESEESSQSSSDENEDDSDVEAIRFEPEAAEISDEDASPRRPKRKRVHLTIDNLGERSDDDEVNVGIPVRWKGKSKRKVVVDSDSEPQPHRSRLIKGARPPTPDDEEDEVDQSHILENRLRARGQKTEYQKTLDKLRNRKRGGAVLQSSSGDDSETLQGPDDPESLSSSEGNHDQSSDEEDDDFIFDLPAAYSMNVHQDLAHHFKIICQLFVHMAYFSLPLQVTRRKLLGMRDSLVVSSVWGPEFKRTLEKYPEFTLLRMDFGLPVCDACRLGGRVSTLLGRAGGTPYDPCDFEDLTDDEEDTDGKEFHLGRFCATRTRVYHEFNHWEYWLYKSLQRRISAVVDNDSDFVEVAYVGGALPPDDPEDADKFMEWLDQRGIIDMEWQKVRKMMESAINLEASSRRGEIDDLA
ncbi:hypothetical protein EDD17DRAFT_1542310, partial [Pisolithus thermaeus]